MKHLLKLKDLDQHEILDILNLADQLKYETKHGIEHHHRLQGICKSCFLPYFLPNVFILKP
jgi:ornithine carbamoyltransferase